MSNTLCKHGWSLRFCEPCSTAAFKASVKGPGDGGMLAMQRELSALRAEVERLRAALRYALEEGTGTQYWGDDDDCGTHSCCGEVSYKDHAPDCWTVKARAALEEKPNG